MAKNLKNLLVVLASKDKKGEKEVDEKKTDKKDSIFEKKSKEDKKDKE